MNTCSLQLIELLNDILDYSRLSLGKAELSPSCTSISEILEEVISILKTKIDDKKQKFHYVLPDLPKYVIVDKKKVVQVLINLISNANKFTAIGGRIIVNVESKADHLEFSVEDNGIGISDSDLKKLFNAFTQVQKSETKIGSGLGLAICKKLVELLGGTISVESRVGSKNQDSGSIFTFTVKYEPFENYEETISKAAKILNGKTILVISSDTDTRMQIGEILFDLKTYPVLCSTSKEALKLISGKRYDFAVAILEIGEVTDLAKQIKDANSELALVCVKNDNAKDITQYDQVIDKPINRVKLIDTLIQTVKKTDISQFELNPVERQNSTEKTIKILIAEDMSYNMEMLIKMLNAMGYSGIDTAKDGEEAVSKLEKTSYDILLLDLKMPVMDGFSVAEHLKDKPNSPKIAVITASVLDSDRERCKELGIKYFILKPFNMTHLKNVMNRLVYGTIRANSIS